LLPLLVLVFVSLVPQGIALSQDNSDQVKKEALKREVLAREEEYQQAAKRQDWDAVARFWDDDIVYDNEGGPATKSEVLKFLKNGLAGDGTDSTRQRFYTTVHNDVQVRVYGDTAVLTTYSTSKIFDRGKWSLGPRQATKVYTKRDGQWILVVRVHAPVTKE